MAFRLSSVIAFGTPPSDLSPGAAEFDLLLAVDSRTDLFMEVGLGTTEPPSRVRFRAAAARARFARQRRCGGAARPSRPRAACSTSGSTGRAPTWRC